MARRTQKRRGAVPPVTPPSHDWRTTDGDEIARRRMRAVEGGYRVVNTDNRHPIFSTFRVEAGEDRRYEVEIRDVGGREAYCTCIDFRVNGLGTCKHAEAVWMRLERREGSALRRAREVGSDRYEMLPDADGRGLRLALPPGASGIPGPLTRWFDASGFGRPESDPVELLGTLAELSRTTFPALRVSREAQAWVDRWSRDRDRNQLRRTYELKVQSGEWPAHETRVPLFPYQREGMLHLAFRERALLADEMGLGKTIQAVAACALLRRLERARRVLVVTPASLKTEWEEQIARFTDLSCHLVYGGRHRRVAWLRSLAEASPEAGPASGGTNAGPFFVVMNYEQVVPDIGEINTLLRPDVVILDEAQRIKNWNTKTALTVKRLQSRYAFVLSGTPLENKIDELRSLVDFLDPSLLGPLFRFNRDFYEFDDRGRPVAYRNLSRLHERVKAVLLRRRKADVETELPPRTDQHLFVPMTESQKKMYGGYEREVLRLVQIAERRPLSEKERESMQIHLAMMRMTCDTPFILEPKDRACPKLAELTRILEDCEANGVQAIVFSEWERMLILVREWCREKGMPHAWHTGSVPQRSRRAAIQAFKTDPSCRVFLTTDAGATGLNLQNASVVVNCDLPWNPARLEQRIARAWRKHQVRNVTVFHLISENTIEDRMLDTLASKKAMAESVLDAPGSVDRLPLRSGRKEMIERLRGLMGRSHETGRNAGDRPPSDRSERDRAEAELRSMRTRFELDPAAEFARYAGERLGVPVISCVERRTGPAGASVTCWTVDSDAPGVRVRLETLRAELVARLGGGVNAAEERVPRVEVVDRATRETIERLVAGGFLASPELVGRPLSWSGEPKPAPLGPDEVARCRTAAHRSRHALRRARLLGDAGFEEECGTSLREAVGHAAAALAVAHRLPEPEAIETSFEPPHRGTWGTGWEAIRDFVATEAETEAGAWRSAADALEGVGSTIDARLAAAG